MIKSVAGKSIVREQTKAMTNIVARIVFFLKTILSKKQTKQTKNKSQGSDTKAKRCYFNDI